jgi:hypothetical protein
LLSVSSAGRGAAGRDAITGGAREQHRKPGAAAVAGDEHLVSVQWLACASSSKALK